MPTAAVTVATLAAEARRIPDDRPRAVWLHDQVRDRVAFGFTPWFDEATPDVTLARGRGHCNPQARLFVTLCRAAGLTARYHAVTLHRDILAGIFPKGGPPPLVTHVFSEVLLDGHWRRTDSYIVDPALRQAAVPDLRQSGRTQGWGVHVDGTDHWDGHGDAFSQFVTPTMAVADLGPFEHYDAILQHPDYCQRYGGLRAATWLLPLRLVASWAEAAANRTLDDLRLRGMAPSLIASGA